MRFPIFFSTALICAMACCGQLEGALSFRDKNSALSLATGTALYLPHNNLSIDGSLETNGAAVQLTEGSLSVANGKLIHDGVEVDLTGLLEWTGSTNQVSLAASDILHGNGGLFVPGILVKAGTSKITGDMFFSAPIVLENSSSILKLGLVNPVNQNIDLNDGRIELLTNLALADGVSLISNGLVAVDGYRFQFGGNHTTPFTANIDWVDALDISLGGEIPLSGRWDFSTDAMISGNGHAIDLTTGGIIAIGSGVTLTLTNVRLRGVGVPTIEFADATSTLILNGATIDLTADLTTVAGKVMVVGSSTFVLGDFDWTFNASGNLTVDGGTLWLDTLSSSVFPPVGQLYIPLAIYGTYPNYDENHASNVASPNYDELNGGFIKLLDDASVAYNTYVQSIGSPAQAQILSGSISGDVVLDKGLVLTSGDVIHITDDASISAAGDAFVFANTSTPQFILDDFKTVRLNHLTLSNVNEHTFDLGRGSVLELGSDVVIEFSENVSFDEGSIIIPEGSGQVVFTSSGAPKVVSLSSDNFSTPFFFDLQGNDLVLDNIELVGLERIRPSFIDNPPHHSARHGKVVLAGNALVSVYSVSYPDLMVKGLNNVIQVDSEEAVFGGTLRFDQGTSENEVRFTFATGAGGSASERKIDFVDDFLRVESLAGTSRITFEDNVEIVNRGENSFLLGQGSILSGHNIFIKTHPIKQLSDAVLFDASVTLATDQDNALDLTELVIRSPLGYWEENAGQTKAIEPLAEPIDALEVKVLSRASIATVVPGALLYSGLIQLSKASGFVCIQGPGKITDFGIHLAQIFDLILVDGASAVQKEDLPLAFKFTDSLTVQGKGNYLYITDQASFAGQLVLEDFAELTIVFIPPQGTNSVCTFADNQLIVLGEGSRLSFLGQGTALMGNDNEFELASGARLLIGESARLTPVDDGEIVISGTGEIVCQDGGMILLTAPGAVDIGNRWTDDIDVVCRRGGGISITAPDGGDDAIMRLSRGRHTLSVRESGFCYIGQTGLVELGTIDGIPQAAGVSSFEVVSNGSFFVDEGGRLTVTDNSPSLGSLLSWNSLGGWIRGTGLCELVRRSTGVQIFEGQLASVAGDVYFSNSSGSFTDISKQLVQQDTSLTTVIKVLAEDGSESVLTGNDVLVTIPEDEEFFEESSDGGFVTLNITSRDQVQYSASGVSQ